MPAGRTSCLQNGDLIRSDHVEGDSNVVNFETYALDLSQLGTPNADAGLRGDGALDAVSDRPDFGRFLFARHTRSA